jgi:hypothetical protein
MIWLSPPRRASSFATFRGVFAPVCWPHCHAPSSPGSLPRLDMRRQLLSSTAAGLLTGLPLCIL